MMRIAPRYTVWRTEGPHELYFEEGFSNIAEAQQEFAHHRNRSDVVEVVLIDNDAREPIVLQKWPA